ncbi:MAG: tetratricopeptide repeat protein [Elusimicrobia bacterium]|nr:tetratricopeptide repeat protein [Elusimicrobiota bacterium]
MKEKNFRVLSNTELFFIIFIFSVILYILFPQKKLMYYATNENKNINLTKIYLKNIIKKYPDNTDAIITLIEILIKNNEYKEADSYLSKLKHGDKKELDDKIRGYDIRISMSLLNNISDEKKKKEYFNEIKDYFTDISIKSINENPALIDDFFNAMIKNREFHLTRDIVLSTVKNNPDMNYKKILVKKYIIFLRSQNKIKDEIPTLLKLENYFLLDTDISNEFLRSYIESSRVDLAKELSIKILKAKKII